MRRGRLNECVPILGSRSLGSETDAESITSSRHDGSGVDVPKIDHLAGGHAVSRGYRTIGLRISPPHTVRGTYSAWESQGFGASGNFIKPYCNVPHSIGAAAKI